MVLLQNKRKIRFYICLLGSWNCDYVLERYGFSAAPLVLGLILGPIAEGNFVEGSMIAQAQNGIFTYFFTGTLNLVLISIVTASIGYSVWLEQRNLKKEVLE